jgi:hypothetical protein
MTAESRPHDSCTTNIKNQFSCKRTQYTIVVLNLPIPRHVHSDILMMKLHLNHCAEL